MVLSIIVISDSSIKGYFESKVSLNPAEGFELVINDTLFTTQS